MTGTHRIVLEVSPELFGRMQTRATGQRCDLNEWLLRTVVAATMKRETPAQYLMRLESYARTAEQNRQATEGGIPHAANI